GSALGVAVLGGLLIATLGRATRDNLAALSLPADVVDRVSSAVSGSAGTAIADLQGQPGAAAVAGAATDAMVLASRLTTGFAAVALRVGLAATFRLPQEAGQARRAEPRPGTVDAGAGAGAGAAQPEGTS